MVIFQSAIQDRFWTLSQLPTPIKTKKKIEVRLGRREEDIFYELAEAVRDHLFSFQSITRLSGRPRLGLLPEEEVIDLCGKFSKT